MAKTTAWLVTVLGVLALPPVMTFFDGMSTNIWGWLVAIILLVIGITKLMRNYSSKRR